MISGPLMDVWCFQPIGDISDGFDPLVNDFNAFDPLGDALDVCWSIRDIFAIFDVLLNFPLHFQPSRNSMGIFEKKYIFLLNYT